MKNKMLDRNSKHPSILKNHPPKLHDMFINPDDPEPELAKKFNKIFQDPGQFQSTSEKFIPSPSPKKSLFGCWSKKSHILGYRPYSDFTFLRQSNLELKNLNIPDVIVHASQVRQGYGQAQTKRKASVGGWSDESFYSIPRLSLAERRVSQISHNRFSFSTHLPGLTEIERSKLVHQVQIPWYKKCFNFRFEILSKTSQKISDKFRKWKSKCSQIFPRKAIESQDSTFFDRKSIARMRKASLQNANQLDNSFDTCHQAYSDSDFRAVAQNLSCKMYLIYRLSCGLPKFLYAKHFKSPELKFGPVKPNTSVARLLNDRLFFKTLLTQKVSSGIFMNKIKPQDMFPDIPRDKFPTNSVVYEFVDAAYQNSTPEEKLDYFTVFFYHGGGFIYFHPQDEYRKFFARFVKIINNLEGKSKIRILAVDYRLCIYEAEYLSDFVDFRGWREDCYESTLALIKNHQKFHINLNKMVLAGDSAGGSIVTSVLCQLNLAGFLKDPVVAKPPNIKNLLLRFTWCFFIALAFLT